MVKLRSRLIRSPFSGSGAGESSTVEGNSNPLQQQEPRGRNDARRHQGRRLSARSDRPQPVPGADEGEIDDESRAPFEELEPSEEQRRGWSRSRSRSRSAVASPGKRKPESRGITASIRRAKTAMLRMASSPVNHPSRNVGGEAGEEGTGGTVGATARDQRQPMEVDDAGEATRRALSFQRSPSHEENVPPLALLSPNCGTLYAHAAGASFGRAAMEVDGEGISASSSKPAARPLAAKNALEWMREDAPPELLPKLLSFCGSRQVNALSRTCRAWNEAVRDEGVWRVMCEDTRKWSDGDAVPKSWARHYRLNPVVPIDYDTVEAALDAVSSGPQISTLENGVRHQHREQREACRILLHPGPYFLRRPLVANAVGGAALTIEAVAGMSDPEHGMTWRRNYHKATATPAVGSSSTPRSRTASEESAASSITLPGDYEGARNNRRPSSPTLRQIFGSCGPRSLSSALDVSRRSGRSSLGGSGHPNPPNADEEDDDLDASSQAANRRAFHQSCFRGRPTPLLCLESRRPNEPVIRIRQGAATLRGLHFVHCCEGTDIWNGNAAVQVQRAFGRDGRPLRVSPNYVAPVATLEDCHVTSLSGRGLVVIDGATADVTDCNFHGSAATGVYVGGGGSAATLAQTDVVDNGTGNARAAPGDGVARGHSGVYVEQGLAALVDCNVSGNTLTGISAVSTEQARLRLEGTDVRGNRSDQVELPPVASGRCVAKNNDVGRTGRGKPRSRRLAAMYEGLETPRGRRSAIEPGTPQSPLE
ncbi:hypothetical protein ACHAXT_000107 [Thalassiosira profunda]